MAEWINVVAQQALADRKHVLVDVNGTDVAVFNLGGEFYAIADVCSHDGTEIASGPLEGDEIICPRHGARFCIKTGEAKCSPAYENVPVYAVRVEDGNIQVADQPF